jgi:membrane-associated phospholipid phosphatase
MFSNVRIFIVLVLLVLTSVLSQAAAIPLADAPAQIAPEAGTWQTWVLSSGDQFRLDAPPDEAATAEEVVQLVEMAANLDDAALQQIAYWNAGAPSYRWNQIALDAMLAQSMPGNMALRDLALLNVAIYDATIAAWDSKYTYNRPRPSEVEPALLTIIPNPASPSYPSEYAVTAGAASTILAWLFPDNAQRFQDWAQEAGNSRLLAGVEYPSDVEAGLELGRQVAELVIERGAADGSAAQWTGSIPTEPGHWTGENPAFPTAGTWATWVLESPDQFRPAAPPAYDSEQMATEMEELRAIERTPVTNSTALFWEYGSGGRRIHWFWNDIATRLILTARWDDNAPLAARAYALTNIAGYDSMVACWDAKFTYWAIRPFQLDPEFSPLFTTPNHPAYPSAHSCLSSAMAVTLAYLFPTDSTEVMALAQQATESRIWAGIHFRSDVEAGMAVGENVANEVITHAMGDGSQ